MANPEHVEVVEQGSDALRAWRQRNTSVHLDLSGANLSAVKLEEGNLSEADLTGAQLIGAYLYRVDLTSADLRKAELYSAELTDADLRGANLSGADLMLARLRGANLVGANLVKADLKEAGLAEADLSGANFSGARLAWANLSGANLSGANLSETDLTNVNFTGASLRGTVFTDAHCGWNVLGDVDLSGVTGLNTVQHEGPSTIGIDTLYKSKGRIPEVFLRGCGAPEGLLAYLASLTGQSLEYFSCVISYTEADDLFSARLYRDLQASGVRCWRWKEDAKSGRAVMGQVDQAVRLYDKLIVICSQASIKAEPVVREIERALQKEQRERKEVLFPIRLDDTIFSWEHALQADVVRKHVADFRRWTDPAVYRSALERLIRDLRAPVTEG